MEKIKPKGSRVLCEVIDYQSRKIGGITIQEAADETMLRGKVIATGGGTYNFGTFVPISTFAGDIVLIPKVGGHKVWLNGKEHVLIEEHLILADHITE